MTQEMKRTYCLLFAATVLLAGCATKETARQAPQPREGLAEHRELLHHASKAMTHALSCLDQVGSQPDRCPPRLVAALGDEVQELQVKSFKVRSRWQAMQARGEVYFEHWQESLAHVKDPRVRELAEKHRPELQESFTRIKISAQQARDAFNPFLSGLRTLKIALENDAGSVRTEANRQLIRVTRDQGEQVEKALTALRQEMDAMAVLLTPGRNN